MNRPVLTTERLTLRPLETRDAPHLHRLVDDPIVARNTLRIPHPYPDGAAAEWIGKNQDELKDGDEVALAIVIRDTDEFIGIIGLLPKPFDVAEIGYWLGQPHWGKGFAPEAAREVIRYAFAERAFNRVEATVFSFNDPSARVLEKAGMKFEGVLRQSVKKGDQYIDTRMYSIVRSEFQR